MSHTVIRKGFGLKQEIKEHLEKDFQSYLINQLKAGDYQLTKGNITVKLAKEYGFCYGVDRSVDYAYQTVKKFPDKKIYLTGEIIHNPFVNKRLVEMGVLFLSGSYHQGESLKDITKDDVVILPAFGITVELLDALKQIGCILVDTTCGSVINVWKHIGRFSRDGFTALVHGKYDHEETRAIVSQTDPAGARSYIIVRNFEEADRVCSYIRDGGDRTEFLDYFKKSISPRFDPGSDLKKVGVANQTTMLAIESFEIARRIRSAMIDRYGESSIDEHFRSFDAICSATQERQDAIIEMLESDIDLSIVIGGFNSSNTSNLTNIAQKYGPAYHIEDVSDLKSKNEIRHKIPDSYEIQLSTGWLPAGKVTIGITAGASTPDAKIEEVIQQLLQLSVESG